MSGGTTNGLQSLQGTDGQSLIDIRDQLEAAAQGAFEGASGGDFRAAVRTAVRQTLTDSGFDVDEVESAMKPKVGRGGRPPGGGSPGGGPPPLGIEDGESFGSHFVESFLSRFREGVNLDVAA